MTFTTFTFALFLVIVFTAYWAMRSRTRQNLLLVVSSYIFYGWWDYKFCALMLISSLVDYGASYNLGRDDLSSGKRRAYLLASIFTNLGLLGFFKYYNFFVDSTASFLASAGFQINPLTLDIILPVGISFYTFQTMGYTIDVYRRHVKPSHKLIDYLAYVSFFPQLVAGPIERAGNLLPQFSNPRTFQYAEAVDGCRQILWGAFKKMVVADNLARFVDPAFADPTMYSGKQLAIATVFFAWQIYCDFSGYTDIAIGTAKLFGFRLMRNFAHPYFSQSIDEFWRRWHISLSTWFRDYLYIPLGGSRVSKFRHIRNVLVTFVVSGFWHGASWNFVIWGAIHGMAVLPTHFLSTDQAKAASRGTPGGERLIPSIKTTVKIGVTFFVACVGWVFFRAQGFDNALLILKKIFTWSSVDAGKTQLQLVGFLTKYQMVSLLIGMIAAEWMMRRHAHALALDRLPRLMRWMTYSAIVWLIFYYGTYLNGQFIYFQF